MGAGWKVFWLASAVCAAAFVAARLLVPHVVPLGYAEEAQPSCLGGGDYACGDVGRLAEEPHAPHLIERVSLEHGSGPTGRVEPQSVQRFFPRDKRNSICALDHAQTGT